MAVKKKGKKPSKKKAVLKKDVETVTKKKTGPKKKSAAKPSKATTKKSASKKASAKKATKRAPIEREFNDHGFVVGSDSAIISEALVEGGFDRNDVNARVAELIDLENRNGNEKNVPSLVSGILNRLLAEGYEIESSWALVPPKKGAKKR